MHACILTNTIRFVVSAALISVHLPAWAAKVPLIESNHMRWNKKDFVLGNAIAWQEERNGKWVTMVVLTDKPIPRDAIGSAKPIDDVMETNKAQGIAFAVTSGGIPLKDEAIRVWFRDGAEIRAANHSGEGGFDISGQSATQIKGRAVLGALGVKAQVGENAWMVNFDAPVLRGDAKRMQADGEPLGATGGQPGVDLLAALQAQRTMDFAALSAYASPDLAAFLSDVAARPKNLKVLQGMTAPQSRIVGGLRQGDKAQVYWVQIWPAALDNRCVDDLILKDGKWRSVASACQAE